MGTYSSRPAVPAAFIAACKDGDIDALKAVKTSRKVDINGVGEVSGDLPLCVAAQAGHLEVVELLVEWGADITATSDTTGKTAKRHIHTGDTALHRAAHGRQLAVVEYLLERGANVNAQNTKLGWGPGHMACWDLHVEVMDVLLHHDLDVNLQDLSGSTVAAIAADKDECAMLKFLLINGADPNIQDKQGNTLLHRAAQHDRVQALEVLLEHGGCDPAVKNTAGFTARELAAECGAKNVMAHDFQAPGSGSCTQS